ncbi:MAG: glycosyltransferase family 2 protein [Sphingomonadaceae bacterium]
MSNRESFLSEHFPAPPDCHAERSEASPATTSETLPSAQDDRYSTPFISVIVPNWNGARYLAGCLDSLRSQSYQHFEVLVVDNGSTDGSDRMVPERYPEFHLLSLGSNLGFAAAVNEGIRRSRGELVALLNNDAEAEIDWLERLAEGAARHPEAGFFACKILLYDRRDVIHSAGDFYSRDGVPGNRGVWQRDEGQFDREEYVLGACGGASGWRRSLFEDVGLFDESLFMYCEDVDLSLRAQLRGHKCVYLPAARVYHRLSATGGGETASFYCGRNFVAVAAKNLPSDVIGHHWPSIIRTQAAFAVHSIWHFREKAARARLKGQVAGLWELPRRWGQRRTIQSSRRVPDGYLSSLLREPESSIERS